jgi:hypothetical protein
MQVHKIGATTESKITLSLMTLGIMTTTKDEAPLKLVKESESSLVNKARA